MEIKVYYLSVVVKLSFNSTISHVIAKTITKKLLFFILKKYNNCVLTPCYNKNYNVYISFFNL